jgi:hypothetical protein
VPVLSLAHFCVSWSIAYIVALYLFGGEPPSLSLSLTLSVVVCVGDGRMSVWGLLI